jgi:hypothetical protein
VTVSGPNNDQRKSARLHNLLSRLETQSVLDQKWRMLYFLYNLSDNAEAPHEPPPAQDARSFSREPTMPSKRQSVAASSHAIQDAFAKPGLTQLPVNAGSPKAPTSTRPASIAEKPEKRRRPDTAKEQQQANGGHVEKAETGPLEPKTIEYCQNDIIHLPALREIYIARIKPEWLNKAKEESEHRATQARSPEYDPQSEGKKLGPWGSGGKERILTIDQMCEMMEEEREEAIARDLFGFDDDLEFLDGDDVWDQEGPGDYEDWGALHSDWDKY